MAQLIIRADGFNLASNYVCVKKGTIVYTDATHTTIATEGWSTSTTTPDTATRNVTFDLSEIPADVIITSAKVHATLGSSTYGAEVSTVNGVGVGAPCEAAVDVELAEGAASVTVPFAFRSYAVEHDHSPTDMTKTNEYWVSNAYFVEYQYQHSGVVSYSDVYLLIEYTPAYTPPELIPYTDPAPVALETYVKAVHMTELHENVNRVRAAYGLEAYAFTAIIAMEPLLAGWNAHAEEIRAALDEIGIEHGEWLALGVNRPRLDVLLQLRSMVRVVAGVEEETDDGSGGAGEDTGGDDSGDEIDENAWMDVTITSVEQTGDGEVTITWEATVDTGVYIPYEVIGDAYAQKPTVYGALTTTITGVSAGVHSYSIMPVDQSLGYNRYGNKSAAVSVTVE